MKSFLFCLGVSMVADVAFDSRTLAFCWALSSIITWSLVSEFIDAEAGGSE